MKQVVDVCCICLRFDVKYYQLDASIQPPSDIPLEDCVEFHGVIQKILKLKGGVKKRRRVICQGCHEEFRRTYHFIYRCAESERILSQLKAVNVRVKKLKMISVDINIKEETDEFFEDDNPNEGDKCLMTNDIRHDDSTSDTLSAFEIVEEEYNNKVKVTGAVRFNFDLCLMKYFDTLEPNANQVNMDPVNGQRFSENSQQRKMDEELIIPSESEKFKNKVKETVKKTNSMKFICKICSKRYASRQGVRNHIKIIHEGRLLKCDQCSATYTCSNNLNAHKQTHDGNMFKCNQCDHQFAGQQYLKNHVNIYHSEKTFRCVMCDEKFKSYTKLRKHKRRKHNIRQYKFKQRVIS